MLPTWAKTIESVSGQNDLDQWGRIKMGDP